MNKPFSWSYSRLRDWETCPRQYEWKHLGPKRVEVKTEERKWGDTVHDALADRVNGRPLPDVLHNLERIGIAIDHAKAAGIQVYAEAGGGKWAFDRDLRMVKDWYGKNVYGRVIVDLAMVAHTRAVIVDYKTGKRRDDALQLKIFAATGFIKFPEVKTVETRYVWTAGGAPHIATYKREEAAWLWNEILPRVDRMEKGIELKQFGPQPSGICKKHCPVLSCPENGMR